jgi:hypothetical protein
VLVGHCDLLRSREGAGGGRRSISHVGHDGGAEETKDGLRTGRPGAAVVVESLKLVPRSSGTMLIGVERFSQQPEARRVIVVALKILMSILGLRHVFTLVHKSWAVDRLSTPPAPLLSRGRTVLVGLAPGSIYPTMSRRIGGTQVRSDSVAQTDRTLELILGL